VGLFSAAAAIPVATSHRGTMDQWSRGGAPPSMVASLIVVPFGELGHLGLSTLMPKCGLDWVALTQFQPNPKKTKTKKKHKNSNNNYCLHLIS